MFGGKELQDGVVNGKQTELYDFHARFYDPVVARWMTQDPMARKYAGLSPYNYCANNPINFIDPTGMDIWVLDSLGNVTEHIKTNLFDAFMVGQQTDDGGWEGSGAETIFFGYGTVRDFRQPTVNVDDGYGNISQMQMTLFSVKGDHNASRLFEFMANPGKTTNVEWSHVKIGFENSNRNMVGTMHGRDFTGVNDYVLQRGYTIREDNHSHVYSNEVSEADSRQAGRLNAIFPEAKSYNYFQPAGGYTPYDASTPIHTSLSTIQK